MTTAHVAVPMIGIVSSLIGTSRRVKATSSWLQPMSCWTDVIGFSGTGKTPEINVTKRAVKQVERDNKPADDAARRAYETKKESAAAAREKWKKEVKEAIEANRPSPEMPIAATDPGKFILPKLHVSDGTIERLANYCRRVRRAFCSCGTSFPGCSPTCPAIAAGRITSSGWRLGTAIPTMSNEWGGSRTSITCSLASREECSRTSWLSHFRATATGCMPVCCSLGQPRPPARI